MTVGGPGATTRPLSVRSEPITPASRERGLAVLTRTPSSPFTSVRHAPRRTGRRILRAVVLGLGSVLVVAALLSAAGWVYAARTLEPIQVAGLAPVTDGAPTNVLVVHTATAEDTEPLSIAILQLGEPGPRALSLPLDLEVTSPGAEPALVRELLGLGGHDRIVAAVRDYTGIPVHHLIQLHLEGLEEVARHAAGPQCPEGTCLEAPFDALRQGGVLAVRELPAHAEQLQEFVNAIHRPTVLGSPLTVKRIVDAGNLAVATDVDLGPRSATRFLGALASADLGQLDVRTVPGFHDPAAGRTTPYWEQAETLFQAFRDGAPLPADLGRTDPSDDLLVAENVRVLVLNGVGIEGLAGRVATHLEERGFDVVGADNVDEFDDDLAVTVVAHRPDRAHEAELVVAELGHATVEERIDLPRGADVVVTVGHDWAER